MSNFTVSNLFDCEELIADIVVVGAGVAGICAALAAARGGASTVLVTDRPVLGGSASGEVGVGMCGAASSPFNFWSRETGIVEEIRNRHAVCWNGDPEAYWTAMDRVYLDMVMAESSLRLLLNTTIVAAEMDATANGSGQPAIASVKGIQLRAEKIYTIAARFFIDCSGDGTLGAMAGAESRLGRESKQEFDESMAPEIADKRTMGATLLWRSRDAGHPIVFNAPAWAIDISKLTAFAHPGVDLTRNIEPACLGSFNGLWWAEYGGQIDSIHDDQQILLHTRALVYGIWDWIKNSGKIANVENQELVHVAALSGKRETRRLIGPVILTENHWRQQSRFDDAVCYSGWPIDVHPPCGYLDSEPGCTHIFLPGPSDVPLRALFSLNVPNLFFAGRCISASHIGLGSPRVQATTGVCGQAVGTAAVFCMRNNTAPAVLTSRQAATIQQQLLRMDQAIAGRCLHEPYDLAQSACITASSTMQPEQLDGENLLALDTSSMPARNNFIDHEPNHQWFSGNAGVLVAIPAPSALEYIDLRFQGDADQEVTAQLFLADRPENYRCHTLIGSCMAKLDIAGWARFVIDRHPGEGGKFLLFLPPQNGLALRVSSMVTPGLAAVRVWNRNTGNHAEEHQLSRTVATPCFRISPIQELFAAASVADGHIRPCGLPHQWRSAVMQPGKSEMLSMVWSSPVRLTQIELVFDSELNSPLDSTATTVRDYELIATVEGSPYCLIHVIGNTRRFVVHRVLPVQTCRLELKINATNGASRAAVYAVRVYA